MYPLCTKCQHNLVKIEVNASSEQSFPIKVKVDVNGQPYRVYNGESNRQISGPALSLYEVDAGSYFSDPSDSDADEDPLVYTYNEDDEDDAIIWDQFFSDDGD